MTSRLTAALRTHGVSPGTAGIAAALLVGPALAAVAPGAAALLGIAPAT